MRYEIFDDAGNIVNTIIAEQKFVDEFYPNRYREIIDPPSAPIFLIKKSAMVARFTFDEWVGIVGAARIDPKVQAWYDFLSFADKVDLKDPRTVIGMNYLVSQNLLHSERSEEILTTPASMSEVAF